MDSNKKSNIVTGIVVGVAAALVVTAGAYYAATQEPQTAERDQQIVGSAPQRNPVPGKTVTVKVFFHKDDLTECSVTKAVERTVPYTIRVADTALRELFKGPTASETQSWGLTNTFSQAYRSDKPVAPLSEYYNGVTITEETAIVDFDSGALEYLNSAACMQQSVKSPIEDTLKQFPTVLHVKYSIDGEIWTEWDA